MTNKERYKHFCESEGCQVPLFMQHWWMESVCFGKSWDVALAYDNDRLVGAMPYLYGRKLGMTYIMQPQLTQFSGPFYCYPDGLTPSQRIDFENSTLRSLLAQVEARRPSYVLIHCAPTVSNWLPFYWAGYSQTTRYTYRLNDISDPDKLFAAFDREKRQRKINRYSATTTVRFDMDPADFASLHARYWHSKGKNDLLSSSFIERVCRNAISRHQGVIASLHDDQQRLLAARFVAYDSMCAYALLSASDPSLHRSGHNEILIWRILQHLSGLCRSFDFEGSMDQGIEYFYRSFGAQQTPFFAISKNNSLFFSLLLKIKK